MLGVGLCAIAAEQVPVEVQQVIDSAKIWKGKGMSGFYDNIRYIGFDSGTKISDIKYGEPFHFYLFTMYSYVNLDANAPISSKLKPRDEWALPLFQHSELKALIWIVRSPDRPNWQVGGYGFHGYGVVWEKACKAWPESEGYHPKYVGNFWGDAFFYVPEKGVHNPTPLHHYGAQVNNADSL